MKRTFSQELHAHALRYYYAWIFYRQHLHQRFMARYRKEYRKFGIDVFLVEVTQPREPVEPSTDTEMIPTVSIGQVQKRRSYCD